MDPGNGLRPGGAKWTEGQKKAIYHDGRHILVSAGAGAGKTMVLVARLLERITNEAEPLEADRLLVVTFTNAAAGEMKRRLAAQLSAKLDQNPQSVHLRRQLLLLNKAQISTVHSFCLDVMREHYHLIGVDPSLRIMNEDESLLLQHDLLEELLEDYYAKNEPDSPFYQLADSCSSVRGDRPLQDLVSKLYLFAWSHPDPEKWLEDQVASFAGAGDANFQHWLELITQDCRMELKKMTTLMQLAYETTALPGGPIPYSENLVQELALLQKALDASFSSWEQLCEAVQEISFATLKQCRGDSYIPALQQRATELRNRCKKELGRLREQYFSRSLEEQKAELRRMAPMLQVLAKLVSDFNRLYKTMKLERGVADFNDLEHYALQILRQPDAAGSMLLPSPAALSYRERFAAVLVDEYQDINQLQEAIITLVSRENPGNIFMVGDVKQSIYRFRLAEPGLFLHKMRLFSSNSPDIDGETIFLTHNFRSRREIIDGVNFLFRQLMDEDVGEVAYDNSAELRSAAYFPAAASTETPADQETTGNEQYGMELLLISQAEACRQASGDNNPGVGAEAADQSQSAEERNEDAPGDMLLTADEEWDAAALEGKAIARRIKEFRGEQDREPLLIYNDKTGTYGPPAYRDIVILMRSNKNYAPAILDELQRHGIPAYAELSTGYFAATEVEVMLALLQVIDNPYQDIPFAAVLRSPILGLRGEELAILRITAPKVPFYEALKTYISLPDEGETLHRQLKNKLRAFMDQLYRWQENARQVPLGTLIWQIYLDSGYYDLVGAMQGGKQRQANLRALHDRARQYEATSFRGLSRFLSFVERLRERGNDLGTARPLGEQEDVVRLITVHKSKGLEFPIVFVSGLARKFNLQDLGNDLLLHKELGFGPKYHDLKQRLVYPTLPWLAVKQRLKLELLAEEMRILYVALTRAGQKLVFVAAVRDAGAKVSKWEEQVLQQELLLPLFERAQASSFLEWLGPALLRHPRAGLLRELARQPDLIKVFTQEPSFLKVKLIPAASVSKQEPSAPGTLTNDTAGLLANLKELKPLPAPATWAKEISRRLGWSYAYPSATRSLAKVSVSALQKLHTAGMEGQDGETTAWLAAELKTGRTGPRFLDTTPSPALRGNAYHMVMRCLDLQQPLDEDGIKQQVAVMVQREQLTAQEQKLVDPYLISVFFQMPLGQRLLASQHLWRECPFTMTLPATRLYAGWQGKDEMVLIQGVIDCVFREAEGLILVDYKLSESADALAMQARYAQQLRCYAHALVQIRNEPVTGMYLYLINQQQAIEIENTSAGNLFSEKEFRLSLPNNMNI